MAKEGYTAEYVQMQIISYIAGSLIDLIQTSTRQDCRPSVVSSALQIVGTMKPENGHFMIDYQNYSSRKANSNAKK